MAKRLDQFSWNLELTYLVQGGSDLCASIFLFLFSFKMATVFRVFRSNVETLRLIFMKFGINVLGAEGKRLMCKIFLICFPFQDGGVFGVFASVTAKRRDRLSWNLESTYLVQRGIYICIRICLFLTCFKIAVMFRVFFALTAKRLDLFSWNLESTYLVQRGRSDVMLRILKFLSRFKMVAVFRIFSSYGRTPWPFFMRLGINVGPTWYKGGAMHFKDF